ncbi:MAG: hypothetical protein ACF8XB_08810 [Planctomycetota bacterium JB042]
MTKAVALVRAPATPSPARAVAPVRSAWIVSPRVDLACVVLSPVLALLLVVVLLGLVESFGSAASLERTRVRLGFFTAVWTGAHLVAVFFRSHADPEVFARHRIRFVVVPPLLYLALVSSAWVTTTALVVTALWDVWHTAMQSFGLGRLYDARAGNSAEEGRGLDLAVNVAVYVAPILAGLSLVPTLAWFELYSALGWEGPARFLVGVGEFAGPIRAAAIGGGGAVVVVWMVRLRARMRRGYRPARAKLLLLASTAVASIVAWGFLPPLEAFVTANLWHALQYFVIVWATERDRIGRVLGPGRFGLPRAATLVAYGLFLAVAGLLYVGVAESALRACLAAALVCSILHFWYDGFVWSVRRRHV